MMELDFNTRKNEHKVYSQSHRLSDACTGGPDRSLSFAATCADLTAKYSTLIDRIEKKIAVAERRTGMEAVEKVYLSEFFAKNGEVFLRARVAFTLKAKLKVEK